MSTEKLQQNHESNPRTSQEEIPWYSVDEKFYIGWCGAKDIKAYQAKKAA